MTSGSTGLAFVYDEEQMDTPDFLAIRCGNVCVFLGLSDNSFVLSTPLLSFFRRKCDVRSILRAMFTEYSKRVSDLIFKVRLRLLIKNRRTQNLLQNAFSTPPMMISVRLGHVLLGSNFRSSRF